MLLRRIFRYWLAAGTGISMPPTPQTKWEAGFLSNGGNISREGLYCFEVFWSLINGFQGYPGWRIRPCQVTWRGGSGECVWAHNRQVFRCSIKKEKHISLTRTSSLNCQCGLTFGRSLGRSAILFGSQVKKLDRGKQLRTLGITWELRFQLILCITTSGKQRSMVATQLPNFGQNSL